MSCRSILFVLIVVVSAGCGTNQNSILGTWYTGGDTSSSGRTSVAVFMKFESGKVTSIGRCKEGSSDPNPVLVQASSSAQIQATSFTISDEATAKAPKVLSTGETTSCTINLLKGTFEFQLQDDGRTLYVVKDGQSERWKRADSLNDY